jgi:hypothetical protein
MTTQEDLDWMAEQYGDHQGSRGGSGMSDDLKKRLLDWEMWDEGDINDAREEAHAYIEKLEAKLAKCQALMHAGLAEYQRRLVVVIKASIAVRSAQKTYFKDRSKDNLIASKQAETSLDKLLVELEGELDD